MLQHLSKLPEFAAEKNMFLKQATEYLKPAIECANDTKTQGNKVDIAAFILGNAGVYGVAAVVHRELGKCTYYDIFVNF